MARFVNMSWCGTLLGLIVFLIATLRGSIFNCDSTSLCSSVNHCASNESCLINCDGNHVCEDKTFHCPSKGKCIINCGTNITQKYSCHQTLFTTQSDTELINITTKGVHSMAESTIFCPSNATRSFAHNCFIYSLEGESQISDINIYAMDSYHDVYIHCSDSHCYDPLHYPTIYCSDYSASCQLELQSLSHNIWSCIISTAICNTISFVHHFPTIAPTNYDVNNSWISTLFPEYNAFMDGPSASILSRRNDVAILLGGILGATFCCSFVLLFVVAAYLMKSKAEKIKALIHVDPRNKERRSFATIASQTDTVSTGNSVRDNHRFAKKQKASNLPPPKPRYKHLKHIKENKEEPSQKTRNASSDAFATERDHLNDLIVSRSSQSFTSSVPQTFSSLQLTQVDFDELARCLKD